MDQQNALTTKKTNLPSTGTELPKNDVLQSDVLVPYLTVMQGLSDHVIKRKAQLGDINKSTDPTKLGDPDKPIDIIFLTAPRANWIEKKIIPGQQRPKFWRMYERTATNERLPWEFWVDANDNEVPEGTPGAIACKRVKQLLAFALLPADIDAANVEFEKAKNGELPDLNKALTPVLVSFASSGYKGGKEVATLATQAKSFRQNIWSYQVKLGAKLEQNDQGSFYVFSVDRNAAKGVNPAHKDLVAFWADIVNTKADTLIIDETEEQGESFQSSAPQTRDVSQEIKNEVY